MAWLLVALFAVSVLYAGWRGAPVAAIAAAALVIAWLAAAVLVAIDYRDVDGFMDCWPRCTAWQDGVGFVVFAGPVMLVILLLGSLAGWLARRGRR
jgi:hypothetical protein